MKRYFVWRDDKEYGPLTVDEIREKLNSGQLQFYDEVRAEDGFKRKKVGTLFSAAGSDAPLAKEAPSAKDAPSNDADAGAMLYSSIVGSDRYPELKFNLKISERVVKCVHGLMLVLSVGGWTFGLFSGPGGWLNEQQYHALIGFPVLVSASYLVCMSSIQMIRVLVDTEENTRTSLAVLRDIKIVLQKQN